MVAHKHNLPKQISYKNRILYISHYIESLKKLTCYTHNWHKTTVKLFKSTSGMNELHVAS